MRKGSLSILVCMLSLIRLPLDASITATPLGVAWSWRAEVTAVRAVYGSTDLETPLVEASAAAQTEPPSGALQSSTPAEPEPGPAGQPEGTPRGPDYLLIAVIGLGLAGTALVALGSALKRSA